jgi:dipeptidyl aminopeptidase/acylaminoacyl peptidase
MGMRGSGKLLAVLAAIAALMVAAPTTQAAFPGDNGKIAFERIVNANREIYVVNPDGTGGTRLTINTADDVTPAWSPDGRRIAFTSDRDGNDEIYVMNPDGSGQTRLTTNPAFDDSPAWSPDGRIVFSSTREGDRGLFVMNADGSSPTRIAPSQTSASQPSWSPDGTRIAFVESFQSVYVMNADGSSARRLLQGSDDGCYGYDQWYDPNWSPDSAQLAVSYYTFFYVNGECGEGEGEYREVDSIAADGSSGWFVSDGGSNGAWSPDGTRVAYIGYNGELRTVDYPAKSDDRVVDPLPNAYDPDWQPLQHGPQRSDYKNAAQFCKAERAFLGDGGFRQKYGGGANAHGKCVSGS